MEKKTDKAKELFISGDFLGALKIFKTFRIGFSTEERRTLEIAHESLTGHEKFYRDLGIDTGDMVSVSRLMIKTKYNL